MNDDSSARASWDELHESARFRPVYPSEPVVRFVARRAGGIGDPVAPERSRTVLDLGCGAGRHLGMVAESGHVAIGMDLSVEGLRHARSRLVGPGGLVAGSMLELPFNDGSFDAVVMYGVINYTDAAGTVAAAHELHRVLRAGGAALIVTRSTRDFRFGKGREVESGTWILDIAETNELGMRMRFLDRTDISSVFSIFRAVSVDTLDHSTAGGTILNADWVIEVEK